MKTFKEPIHEIQRYAQNDKAVAGDSSIYA